MGIIGMLLGMCCGCGLCTLCLPIFQPLQIIVSGLGMVLGGLACNVCMVGSILGLGLVTMFTGFPAILMLIIDIMMGLDGVSLVNGG